MPRAGPGGGGVVCGAATEPRRGEPRLRMYFCQTHGAYGDPSHFWADFTSNDGATPTIEGGDVLVASRELLLVGHTQRTTRAAIRHLAKSLQRARAGVKTIIIVELPKQRSFMHLDTVFTFTSRHECLIYPPVILPRGSQPATVTSMDLTKKSLAFTSHK